MDLIMKRKQSKVLYYKQAVFFTEPTSFLVISTVQRTDMGICYFKNMRSIKIVSLRKEIVLSVFP